MAISKEQQRELKNLARAANRRLERASEGQRASLEFNIKKYHTQKGKYGISFSQAAAKTEREYKQRMAELEKFMQAKTSTKRGWNALQESNIEKAVGTLDQMGYDITEEELAVILRELKGLKGKDFYTVLENVEAAKYEKESSGEEFTEKDLKKELNTRREEYEATLKSMKARIEREKKRAAENV